jgi:hypothetical protein
LFAVSFVCRTSLFSTLIGFLLLRCFGNDFRFDRLQYKTTTTVKSH